MHNLRLLLALSFLIVFFGCVENEIERYDVLISVEPHGPFNICAYDPSPLEVSPSAKPILSYYSNPVGNRLAVESPYYILSLSVYDLSGREVLSQIPNKKQLTVNTYSFAAAVYLMRVQTTNGIKTVKLVKR